MECLPERAASFWSHRPDITGTRKHPVRNAIFVLLLSFLAALVFVGFLDWDSLTASPGPGAPTSRDPEEIQKELEAFLLADDFPQAWQKLAELKPLWSHDARYYQAEGALYMVQTHDYAKARESFLKALELAPSDQELVYNLAEANFALGNYRQAETGYKKLKYDWKDNEIIPFRLYLCALRQKNRPEAEYQIEDSARAFQSPSWFYIRAVEAFQSGQKPVGKKLLDTARLMYGTKTRLFDQAVQDLIFSTGGTKKEGK